MIRIQTQADLLAGMEALSRLDSRLAPLIDPGAPPPLRRREAGLEGLVWIITGQQISLASAEAIWRRTRSQVGRFEPRRIIDMRDEDWRAAGQSRPKIVAIRAVAGAMLSGDLDFDDLAELDDDGAGQTLQQIKGVGPWTAAMYLLACEGRPDVWPAGDVALQAAAADVLGLSRRPSSQEMIGVAEPWRPWRAIAARVLWAHYRTLT